ncbi:hypothetical protein Tco_0633599 [Tanacetum coccineum]
MTTPANYTTLLDCFYRSGSWSLVFLIENQCSNHNLSHSAASDGNCWGRRARLILTFGNNGRGFVGQLQNQILLLHGSSQNDKRTVIPADNVPAGRSSNIPADYVSAGHVRVPC